MRTISLFTCGIILSLKAIGAANETGSDKLARAAYREFCRDFNKKDLAGIMKIMDVPFLAKGKPVIKDRAALRKFWKDNVSGDMGATLPLTKFKVEPVSVLQKAGKEDKDFQDFLGKLEKFRLTREDRVVNDGLLIVVVRVRKDEAKIVALFTVPLRIQGKIFP